MQLLAEDAERQERLYEQVSDTLRDRLNWVTSAAEPPGGAGAVAEDLRLVNGFEQDEHHGSLTLRNLAAHARDKGEMLVCVLLECLAMDSDKRAHLLRFVRRRLSARE
jgi:hypothetical protein